MWHCDEWNVAVHAAGSEASARLEKGVGSRRQMVREGREEFSEEAEEVRRTRGVGEGRVVPESQHQMRDNTQVKDCFKFKVKLWICWQAAGDGPREIGPANHARAPIGTKFESLLSRFWKNCLSQFLEFIHKSILGHHTPEWKELGLSIIVKTADNKPRVFNNIQVQDGCGIQTSCCFWFRNRTPEYNVRNNVCFEFQLHLSTKFYWTLVDIVVNKNFLLTVY